MFNVFVVVTARHVFISYQLDIKRRIGGGAGEECALSPTDDRSTKLECPSGYPPRCHLTPHAVIEASGLIMPFRGTGLVRARGCNVEEGRRRGREGGRVPVCPGRGG